MHLRKTFQKCGNRSGEASCSDSKKNQWKRLTCHDVTGIDVDHGHILGNLVIGCNKLTWRG